VLSVLSPLKSLTPPSKLGAWAVTFREFFFSENVLKLKYFYFSYDNFDPAAFVLKPRSGCVVSFTAVAK
jgi:hypothetical protein